MRPRTSTPVSVFEKVLRAFETGGFTFSEVRAQLTRLLATGASPTDLLEILRRRESGCIFLEGNDCSIYEARPDTCRDFPHLIRGAGSFESRMWQMVDRATYCPIVYNSLEEFKDMVKFKR